MKDETRLVHAGRDPFTHHGAVNVPVYHASTILSPDLDDFEKRDRRVTYGRTGTPTTFALEDIVSALEQADDTISAVPASAPSAPPCWPCAAPAIMCWRPTMSTRP